MSEDINAIKIDALKELIENRFIALDEARELQAREYERRLEILNHEAEQLKEMQNTYVKQETYCIERKIIQENVRSLVSFKDNLSGKIAIIGIMSGLISSIFVALIIWFITGR